MKPAIRFDPPLRRWPGALLGALASLVLLAWIGAGLAAPEPRPSPTESVVVAGPTPAALAAAAVARPADAAPARALSADDERRSDGQDPDPACPHERLTVVESDRPSWALCSAGGASRSWHDDGGQTVSVRGPAADALRLQFDAAGRVLRVELDGLSCREAGCSGAAVVASAAPAPSGESADVGGRLPLRLEFAGVSLDDGRPGGRRASLNGVVQVPAW